MFLPVDITPTPLTTFTYICHRCDAEENRPFPLLPASWTAALSDEIECAVCPDCTAAAHQRAEQASAAEMRSEAAAQATITASLERQVALGARLVDGTLSAIHPTIAVLFGIGLATQLSKLGDVL
ncbi:hypothetical protein [Croceibacterium ferulae]|uniref:hypothetical protein n=1 Tax=Croceibacterium ferulae TaxID=1854641 RepID=UPI000EB245AC|nr:hypothetical protein [Croceibacterium ferulae]